MTDDEILARAAGRELPPVAEAVEVTGAMRNDEPMAQLTFIDVISDARTIQLGVNAALELQARLAAFLVHAARR